MSWCAGSEHGGRPTGHRRGGGFAGVRPRLLPQRTSHSGVARTPTSADARLACWDLRTKPEPDKAAARPLAVPASTAPTCARRSSPACAFEGASFAGARMERFRLHGCRLDRAAFRGRAPSPELSSAALQRAATRAGPKQLLYRTQRPPLDLVGRGSAGDACWRPILVARRFQRAPPRDCCAVTGMVIWSCAFSPDGGSDRVGW